MSDSIHVVDNFLPDELFPAFADVCMTSPVYRPCDFASYHEEADGSIHRYGEDLTPVESKSFAEVIMQCIIFGKDPIITRVNDIYLAHPLFFKKLEEYLNVKRWWMIRVNCTIGQPKQHIGAFHVDFDENLLLNHDQTTTSILYLNTNNGGTKFKETDEFVQSKKNRLVTFPTPTEHAGVWCTDAKLRYVLNMTYETK